jgi:hypothetical protein
MPDAIKSLQDILIRVRTLIGDEDFRSAYRLLDHAEYLPTLLLSEEDASAKYREVLESIRATVPGCAYIADRFAANDP